MRECTIPYGKAVLIAFDQFVNAVLGGWSDETFSSRCWRWHITDRMHWPKIVVDSLFFFDDNHCEESFHSERLGRQLPPECRPKM